MKKKKVYYLVVILGILVCVYLSCSRSTPNALRIVEINKSGPLIVDVYDRAMIRDPEDPQDTTLIAVVFIKDWIVPITVTYTETGIGLPTYPTTYTAKITKYTVSFENTKVRIGGVDVNWKLSSLSGAANILVPSDPDGLSTITAQLKVIPKEWIEARADTLALGCMVKANIILEGKEELNGNVVVDTGAFTIDFADYYDDPIKVGQ